jgi:hypothetical protein
MRSATADRIPRSNPNSKSYKQKKSTVDEVEGFKARANAANMSYDQYRAHLRRIRRKVQAHKRRHK